MKKKWLSVVALSMCFCMGVGTFASCKGGDDESTGGTSNSEQTSVPEQQEEKPLTKDEIYAETVKAAEATAKYKGALFIDAVMKQTMVGNGETQSNAIAAKISLDPTQKFMYNVMTTTMVQGETTQSMERVEKLFKEGDSYYLYNKDSMSGEAEAEPNYQRATETYVNESFSEVQLDDVIDESDMPMDITSIDAFNAAWAEVFTGSKAQIAAETANEESEWYQCVADGSCVVSCEEVDGAFVVTLKMNAEMTKAEEKTSMLSEVKLVAKNGYLAEMSMKNVNARVWYETSEDPAVTEPVKMEEEYGSEMSYAFTYSFNQTGYDAIVTELPEVVEDMEEDDDSNSGYEKYLNLEINGVKSGRSINGEDIQTAVTNFMEESTYWDGSMSVVWYTDEACTNALTANITEEELDALDTLYGKATPHEGYSFVITKERTEYAEDVTEGYKLAFSWVMDGNESEWISAYQTSFGINEREDVIVKVNGEVVTFTEEDEGYKEIPLTAGETYTVEYVSIYTKADLNIFNML